MTARVWHFPSLRNIAHRLLLSIPVLLVVTLLTFFMVDLLPGNAAQQLLGAEASAEQVARMQAQLRLDRPAAERYLLWINDTARGNLGRSLASRQFVTDLIRERLPVTLELILYALILSLGLATPLALLAACLPNGLVDRCIAVFSMMGISTASYVLALLLVLAFAVHLSWFPSIGFSPLNDGIPRNVRSMTLPAFAIALPYACFYTRLLRGDLIEQMTTEGYVIAAFARGLGRARVLVRHALRNSLFGLLTTVSLHFGALLGGTVVIEQIFALPGIGQLLLQSINTRDVAVVQAIVLLMASSTMLANLTADLLYGALDPRVLHGHR